MNPTTEQEDGIQIAFGNLLFKHSYRSPFKANLLQGTKSTSTRMTYNVSSSRMTLWHRIGDKIWLWIYNFLVKNRKQSIVVDGFFFWLFNWLLVSLVTRSDTT